MNTKLYVGNLTNKTTENDLHTLFSQHAPVTEVQLMVDRTTGCSRGFALVTMATPEGSDAASHALNGRSFQGRVLVVNEMPMANFVGGRTLRRDHRVRY
jgi:RNA recognition motif-containing protein